MKALTFLFLLPIFVASTAIGAAPTSKNLQICSMKCESRFCKKLAEEVEFEFELLNGYLLPPCKSLKAKRLPKDFRLVFFENKEERQVEIKLECLNQQICMTQSYNQETQGASLVAQVVSDVRSAIKHSKPLIPATKVEPVAQAPEVPTAKEEWDQIVVPLPPTPQPQIAIAPVPTVELVQDTPTQPRTFIGSATLSFGGENWNYAFDSDSTSERLGSVHSRIYPRMSLSASFWPLPFLRVTTMVGASVASFRIKANQPVDGDGRVVLGQMYQGSLIVGAFQNLWDIVHVGVDGGYDFQGAFIEKQRIADRPVTIAPTFISHGLRIGPRVLIGALSERGMIDIGAGFYPYHYYEESPDEPTVAKGLFSWSLHGSGRLMITSDMYADASLRAQIFHVHYTDDAQRESADGEKWGPGQVTNASTSAMAGLGWLF